MIQGDFKEATILHEKISCGTLRRVFYKNHRIYKHFTTVKWPGDLRKPWRIEAKALTYLHEKGIECPELLSLHEKGRQAVLCKAFVDGEPLSEIALDNVELVASNLAAINAAGVLTCDPHVGNFLLTSDNKITFIDFGRSRIFRNRLPFFLFYLGKEKARITHLLLSATDDHLKDRFWHTYTETLGKIKDPRGIAKISEKYWLKRMGDKTQYSGNPQRQQGDSA